MNNLLPNTTGIDTTIQNVQKELYDSLFPIWNEKLEGFGRAYKNLTKGKNGDIIVPEVHVEDSNDYKDVFHEDFNNATFFFLENKDEDETEDEMVFTSRVRVVFMVDLKEIFPNDKTRSDAKAQRDVISVLRESTYAKIHSIKKDMNSIFRGTDFSAIKYENIHPRHCFAIDIDIDYYLIDKCG